MKKLLLFMCMIPSTLFAGMTQTHKTHESKVEVDREFTNIYLNAQPKQWVVFNTTPALNQLQDGQVVLVSSTNNGIAWRKGQTVYFFTSSGALSSTSIVTFTSNTYISNGVSQLVAGTNITLNPAGGTGVVTVNSSGGGAVTSLIAGTNITLSPITGLGDVTINSTGGGSLWDLDADGKLIPVQASSIDSNWELDADGKLIPKL